MEQPQMEQQTQMEQQLYLYLTQLARMGAILYLVALAVQPLTGWDLWMIIVGTGVLVIIYTLVGGIEAVIWTDVVQSLVLTAGIIISLVVIAFDTPGGIPAISEAAAASQKFSLGSFGMTLQKPTFWVVLVYACSSYLAWH